MHLCSSPYVKPIHCMHGLTLLDTNKSSETQQPNTASLSQKPLQDMFALGKSNCKCCCKHYFNYLIGSEALLLFKIILIYLCLSTIS